MNQKTTLAITFLLAASTFTQLTNAGALSDFESSKSEPSPSYENNSSGDHSSRNDDQNDYGHSNNSSFIAFLFEMFFKSIAYVAVYGGDSSTDRYTSSPHDKELHKRQIGEPLIPRYRFDYHYLKANSGIKASDFRFEAGKGPYAFQFRTTAMTETASEDRLQLSQMHALYRMSFGNYVGVNAGIGVAKLTGNQSRSAISMTFPIYFHPWKHVGFELKTSAHLFDNAAILDRDYSILLTKKGYSVAFGYRELKKTGIDIKGPYVGFSVHY